ncbi:non-ribosomal peptide synthetase [Spongiimicrobium salis]|uniref:non-ribosomal peptide synthetase n=1 Tax=Spongiimicrobium salis TaxID=1667022 RepID=UPI00374DDE7D
MKQPSIIKQNKNAFDPFAGPAIERVMYTTQAQAEIWIACKLGGEDANRAYNESVSLVLTGALNQIILEHSVEELIQRHQALRATFSADGRFMCVFKEVPIDIVNQDFSSLPENERERALAAYLLEDANYVFDLIRGPLFKVGLLKINPFEHRLILTAHHIICDGWSTGIMLEELGGLYSAYVSNKIPTLPEVDSFDSFVDEQQSFIESDAYKKTLRFWLQQYESSIPQLSLPTDFPRPELRTYKSERLDFAIDRDLLAALKKTGVKAGCSFVTTLMTAFEVFLYQQSGQDDIVLGLPSAGQSVLGKTQLVGHCVNLLPLRTKISQDISFTDYLKQRKSAIFDAYDHQQLSFGQLLQKLSISRDPSRVPLVPVIFNIDMGMTNQVSFTDLSYKLISNPRTYEAFELFLNATGTEDALILEWSYNTSLFKATTIEQMMVSFKEILTKIVAAPHAAIGTIAKADDTAYRKLNQTQASYPQLSLHELLAKQAQRFAKRRAIIYGETEISYEQFEERVNQLAHLLTQKGVATGTIVGVSLPRSIELVITLTAIMQCGGAYLPLDHSYPNQRLEFMMDDADVGVLISSNTFSSTPKTEATTFFIEDLFSNLHTLPTTPLAKTIPNDQLVYILYTSGSTGKPKGVPVTHKNLLNFLYSMLEEPGITENDRLLSISTISFDIAGLELFLPLLKGAELVIANDETAKDSRLLLELLVKEDITILQATPTSWQMLLDAGWEQKLPLKALTGGEALPMRLAKKILNRVNELWNVYGPTETTVWSTVKQITLDDDIITIGHPITNMQFYIVNEQGVLVAPGTIGEICIAGDGVTEGYWKRPDLTLEKFIPNPFNAALGTTLYRSGDLGRLLPNGELQCLGRIDHQVKIRGHRIELGEIEDVVHRLEGVHSAVVLVHDNRLVANIVPIAKEELPENHMVLWKQEVTAQLPPHMVPYDFKLFTEFPTTLNGKIDRKALLKSDSETTENHSFTGPRNKTEALLSRIWEECLEMEKIDVFSDFFELGGHSLLALRIMTQIEKETGKRLAISSLLEYPTIAKLASFIAIHDEPTALDSLVPIKEGGNKTPLYIVHGGDYNVLIFHALAKNLDDDQPVYGLQAKGLNGIDEPHDCVKEMASDYIKEIMKANPEGPYALAGYSFGGVIAFEMARQLTAQGKKVNTVALLDSYVFPNYYYASPLKKKMVSALYLVGKVGFAIKTMFYSVSHFKRRMRLLKNGLYHHYLKLKHGKEKHHEMLYNWPLKLDTMHHQAICRYHMVPQDIEVDLFRVSTNDIYFAHDPKYLGWKKFALKGVQKHMIPGNHQDMFSSPNVETMGRTMQEILDVRDGKTKDKR